MSNEGVNYLQVLDQPPVPDNFNLDKGGVKDDKNKLRYDLIPPCPHAELARVYTVGAEKYADYNWAKGLRWGRIIAAMERHLQEVKMGRWINHQDGGLAHIMQTAWGCYTLYEHHRLGIGNDDRFVR